MLIDLKHHIPTFLWNNVKVLNEYGEPIISNDGKMVYHFRRSEDLLGQVLDSYKLLNNILDKRKLSISKLSLSNNGNWKLVVESFTEINLGKTLDYIRYFLFFYDKGYRLSEIKSIDARYPDGFSYVKDFGSESS